MFEMIALPDCPRCKPLKEKYGNVIKILDEIDSLTVASFNNILTSPALIDEESGAIIIDYDEVLKTLESLRIGAE